LLVKLGGSVITNKAKLRTARPAAISRLALEVAAARDQVVLVHGAGSFGHILAKKYRLQDGYRSKSQVRGIAIVQRDVRQLNLMVLDALMAAGIHPSSLPPSTVARLSGGDLINLDTAIFRDCLRMGMMPVTFGDVVPDSQRIFGICSGDDLMIELSGGFRPTKSLFVTDVDGVFTSDPKKSRRSKLLPEVRAADLGAVDLSTRTGVDVTGGIEAKLRKVFDAAGFAKETWILNGLAPGRLKSAVLGRPFIGTRVVA